MNYYLSFNLYFILQKQERLLQKLGSNACAFSFQLPVTAPASIVLQEGSADDSAPPVGVEYDFNTYVSENAEDRSHKRSSVSMAIRKVINNSYLSYNKCQKRKKKEKIDPRLLQST